MSSPSKIPLMEDGAAVSDNFDTSNPVIAEVLRVKEERLKILHELNKQGQEDMNDSDNSLKDDVVEKKRRGSFHKNRKSKSEASLVYPRRSARLHNSPTVKCEEDDLGESAKVSFIRPPNDYGAVPGVEVGTCWESRMGCSQSGIHRPTVAGIHGGPDGAYSIALSGGYPEDIDEGETFIYTGAGGRDLRGSVTKPRNLRIAPQTKDQQLEGTNLSLVRSIETKLPVRVIRGFRSRSNFAPIAGYRYDGLYQVTEFWEDLGKTGFKIYRFKLQRMKDQAPPPWETNRELSANGKDSASRQENVATEGSVQAGDEGQVEECKQVKEYEEKEECNQVKEHEEKEECNQVKEHEEEEERNHVKEHEEEEERNQVKEHEEEEECNQVKEYKEVEECNQVKEYNQDEDCNQIKEYNQVEDCNQIKEYNHVEDCNHIGDYNQMEDCNHVQDYNQIENCNQFETYNHVEDYNELESSINIEDLYNETQVCVESLCKSEGLAAVVDILKEEAFQGWD